MRPHRRRRRAKTPLGKIAQRLRVKKSRVQFWAVAGLGLLLVLTALIIILTRDPPQPKDEVWQTGALSSPEQTFASLEPRPLSNP